MAIQLHSEHWSGALHPKCILAVNGPNRDLVEPLEFDNFEVAVVADGMAVLREARNGVCDAIVLETALRVLDASTVIRTLRRDRADMPIVVLCDGVSQSDAILCLERGADAMLPRSASAAVIAAQIRALQRRGNRYEFEPVVKPQVIEFGALVINESTRRATVGRTTLSLRPLEYKLLLALAKSPGVALSRKTIIERVWGDEFEGVERTIDSHVRRLRMQLERDDEFRLCVRTLRGFGYRFEPPSANAHQGPTG